MAKIVNTLNKLLEGQLESDETLISGVRVNLKGTAFGVGLSALGGVGLIAGSKIMQEGQDQAKDSGIEFAQQMALGLTNKRIILFKRSAFSGKPKNVLGSIPISQVKGVDFEPGGLGDKMTLNFGEDKVLELESVKVDKGRNFVDELTRYL